uniref:Uncharacterized protein n=1 Tax=Rhizophora mucronata TaxID=61149 RepID=A0A2P2P653_RHIMU
MLYNPKQPQLTIRNFLFVTKDSKMIQGIVFTDQTFFRNQGSSYISSNYHQQNGTLQLAFKKKKSLAAKFFCQ